MSRRISCRTRSEAGVGQSGLLSDNKYTKVYKGVETRADRDASSFSPVSKVKYSLRSGHRQTSSSVGSRCAQRPIVFVSQSRERYLSDVDDNEDSISLADDESERDESNVLPEVDGESTDLDADEIHSHITRQQIPDITDDVDIPFLILPETAIDLVIDPEVSLQAVGIYQVLRQFSRILHLSVFRFEDFCSALTVNEQSCLLAETHIALLKCILQEEDCSNSIFGPTDAKDSINISLYVVDAVTWFEAVRMYMESLSSVDDDFQQVLGLFSCSHYQDLQTSQRLLLLQILTDLFLATNLVREAIMNEGAFIHEEQCRFCHRRGDLICCETCPAVFHLECVKPPLTAVPDDDWFCCVCSALQVKGVNECLSDIKKDSLLCRLEPIGYDRHQRKYWFLCRRVFIEAEGRTWYYSTPTQLEELMLALDNERWEVDLVSDLNAIKSVIVGQMTITEELTNKVKGKRNSALAAHDELLRVQRLKNKSLQTVTYMNSMEQRVEGSDKDRKPSNILNENYVKANLEESFGVQDLRMSGETKRVKVENVKETSNNPEVSNCQNQGKEVGSEETKKLEAAHEALADDISVVSNVMILKNDNASSAVADAAVVVEAGVNHSAEGGQQNVKASSDENDGTRTAKSSEELLSSVTQSLPFVQSINRLSSETAVEMSNSSAASDSISEMRQTRSKSRHLVGVNTSETDKQSNCEQHFGPYPVLFKLGMEGNYKTYVNLYSTNPLALSKQQQNDDREKRRHLSYKFSLTPLSEFVWSGVIYGQSRQTVDAVKRMLLKMEATIDQCFFHPNWCLNSGRWQKAVGLCSTAAEFALALMILEACMKPLLFNSVWHESLGHVKLRRTTAAEKEEQKKKEKEMKRIRYEDEWVASTWVKYSLGLRHQVWKQKGEEYRSTGKGGWFWVSSTRVKQPTNLKKCDLLKIFRKNCQSEKASVFNRRDRNKETVISQESISCESFQPSTGDSKDSDERSVSNDISQVTERTEFNCGAIKLSEVETEEHDWHLGKHAEETFIDCFDVSETLLSRSCYKKKSAINCVLDGLLERRTRQLELEMEQKAALELALQKFHADALTKQKGSSSCPPSHTSLDSGNSNTLSSPKRGNYVAKLNFAKQKVADSEQSRDKTGEKKEEEEEEEEEEENSDNEVTLEKEDLEDSSSVDSCAARCQAEDIVMGSEDSNISNASSLAANIIPPPVQSKSFRHALLQQNGSCLKTFQAASVRDKSLPPYGSAAEADATQIEICCSHNVINSLKQYIKDGNIILTKVIAEEIKEKLNEVGKTEFQVTLLKEMNSVTEKKKRKQIKKGSIPRAHNFLTSGKRRSLFVLERDERALLARKGGQKEALGFNYACKIHEVSWPYPFPRPFFKTAWKYRTQTAKNLSAIALQLRILWANIRWDDMAIKCAAGKNTTTTETELTTVELLKRRDIGPANLRAEYLIQKTVSPLDVPVSNKERALPSQRSGLRERRQQEASVSREPVISEFWVPEEQLELWQVRLFAERLKKKQHKQKEKTTEKKVKTSTPCGKLLESNSSVCRTSSRNLLEKKMTHEPIVKVGSAAVEEELQQQRMLMRQRRLGLSLLRGDQMNSLSPSSTKDSVTSATRSASQNNMPRSLKLPFRRLGVPKTNNNIALSGSANIRPAVVSCPVSPPQSIRLPGSGSQCLPLAAHVVCAPISSPPPMSSSPATLSAVQSIRIRKGPDGQLQITGLQPGQEIIRLPDGRLRLVAKALPIDRPSVAPPEEFNHSSSSSSSTTPLKIMSSAQPFEKVCNSAEVHNMQSEDAKVVYEHEVQQKPQNRKESGQERPELMLPSAGKQTSVTVATAVEKLFACLSPMRLQNKRRFSEKADCNRQSSSEEAHERQFMKNPTGGSIAESMHVSTTCSMQSKDRVVFSGTGLGHSPSQTEPTCLSLPTDKQKDHSDKRSDEYQHQFPTAMVADDDVGHPATLSDNPDFHCKSQNNAWIEGAWSETSNAGSVQVRQWPSSPKGDLTDEGIGNRHTSEVELSMAAAQVSGTAGPLNEAQGSPPKRTRKGSVGTVAVKEELPETSRKKDTGCKSTIVKERAENQSSFHRSKTTSNKTDKVIRRSCKRKLSGTGISPSFGEPLKKYQAEMKQLPGEKKSALDVSRQRLEEDKRSDKGEPSVLPTETTKKQSKKINASAGNSHSYTVKQNLKKLPTDEKGKLLCICRTHYDPSRFYVGCDVCLNWFHGSCVNISEKEVFAIGSFICSTCKPQQSNNAKGIEEEEELFCICHQPYDESRFYIGCNDCGGWFHGSCVAVSPSDVGRMECYTCPTCNVRRGCSRFELQEQHFFSLKRLISTLKLNSLAKPFCKETNKAENQVISERIDFSVVEQKIESCTYFLLDDFVTDVLEIFHKCRLDNSRSPLFSRAIKLEIEFMSQFEKLKTEVFQL